MIRTLDQGLIDMTQESRRAELRKLTTTDAGRDELLAIWHRATGTPEGAMPAIGTLMIGDILAHEFPPDAPDPAGG